MKVTTVLAALALATTTIAAPSPPANDLSLRELLTRPSIGNPAETIAKRACQKGCSWKDGHCDCSRGRPPHIQPPDEAESIEKREAAKKRQVNEAVEKRSELVEKRSEALEKRTVCEAPCRPRAHNLGCRCPPPNLRRPDDVESIGKRSEVIEKRQCPLNCVCNRYGDRRCLPPVLPSSQDVDVVERRDEPVEPVEENSPEIFQRSDRCGQCFDTGAGGCLCTGLTEPGGPTGPGTGNPATGRKTRKKGGSKRSEATQMLGLTPLKTVEKRDEPVESVEEKSPETVQRPGRCGYCLPLTDGTCFCSGLGGELAEKKKKKPNYVDGVDDGVEKRYAAMEMLLEMTPFYPVEKRDDPVKSVEEKSPETLQRRLDCGHCYNLGKFGCMCPGPEGP